MVQPFICHADEEVDLRVRNWDLCLRLAACEMLTRHPVRIPSTVGYLSLKFRGEVGVLMQMERHPHKMGCSHWGPECGQRGKGCLASRSRSKTSNSGFHRPPVCLSVTPVPVIRVASNGMCGGHGIQSPWDCPMGQSLHFL